MVAFSSAAQIGYIYMGLGLGTQAALLAVFFQIFAHALTKPMLFLSSAGLIAASGGRQEIRDMRGAGHRDAVSGVLFTIGALSMVGIPIFAGFVPKLYFALAAFHMGWRTWVVLLALAVSTVLNVLYFLYAAILLWLPEQQERLPAGAGAGRLSMQAAAAPAALAILNLLVGLQPSALTQFLQQGMELFCK